ncbi:hypothetical protein [Streptomyces sp. NPDC102360]|uniref:hypothetical protein n=1 Tax=Streptomyces sp. NPDC102360 TaxID=3366160 RepID=UPI00382797CF
MRVRAALEELTRQGPNFPAPLTESGWDKRYGHRVEIHRVPDGAAGITALAESIGQDEPRPMVALWSADAP